MVEEVEKENHDREIMTDDLTGDTNGDLQSLPSLLFTANGYLHNDLLLQKQPFTSIIN